MVIAGFLLILVLAMIGVMLLAVLRHAPKPKKTKKRKIRTVIRKRPSSKKKGQSQ